jgi:hypothetical protein
MGDKEARLVNRMATNQFHLWSALRVFVPEKNLKDCSIPELEISTFDTYLEPIGCLRSFDQIWSSLGNCTL